jgi:hypothetical protein
MNGRCIFKGLGEDWRIILKLIGSNQSEGKWEGKLF